MTPLVANIVNLVRLMSRDVLHASDCARILNPWASGLMSRGGWLI